MQNFVPVLVLSCLIKPHTHKTVHIPSFLLRDLTKSNLSMSLFGKLVSRKFVLNVGSLKATGARRQVSTFPPTKPPPKDKNEFLFKPGLQEVINNYAKSLKVQPTYGVPTRWSTDLCNQEFLKSHKSHIIDFEAIAYRDSEPRFYISMESFIGLYMRCVINDIPELLYFLALEGIKVNYSDENMILRLNDLIRINDEVNFPLSLSAVTLRTDASVDTQGYQSGFGCILLDDAGDYICINGMFLCAGYGKVQREAIVTESELTAVYEGIKFAKEKGVRCLRILTDSDDVFRILEGKAIKKNIQAVMDLMCKIGMALKEFDYYSAGFMYRELNKDCDYLASCGRSGDSWSKSVIGKYRHFPKFRIGRESLKSFTPAITTPTAN